MSRIYPGNLQAALLFGASNPMQTTTLDWPKLIEQLNTCLANEADLAPINNPIQSKPDASILMSNGRFHIAITVKANAFEANGLSRPLRSPFYAKMQPSLIEAVKSHQSHILIEVGQGDRPETNEHLLDEAGRRVEDSDFDEDQDMFEARLRLTKTVSSLINEASPGGTVYWGQSEQLYASAAFATITENSFPLPLFIHPFFHASGATKKGQVLAGINGFGSQHLLGKPVVFAEHVQPMMQSYERLLDFVAHCRSSGDTIEDGGCFGRDKGEQIVVYHRPATPPNPAGWIELVLNAADSPVGRSGMVIPDEGAVLRNAFLGRSDAPQKVGVLGLPNVFSAITSRIGAVTRATLAAVTKTKIKNN